MVKRGRKPKVIELTKLGEKQLTYLHKKGVKITRAEFKEYYDSVRKANKKLGSKQFKNTALKANLYTLSVKRITDRKEFLSNRRRVKNVLNRDYKKKLNASMREQLYKNIRRDLGIRNSKPIIDLLKEMKDETIIKFFNVNRDIESMLYDSNNPISQFIDLTTEQFNNRLEAFKTRYTQILKEQEYAEKNIIDQEYSRYRPRRRRKRKI